MYLFCYRTIQDPRSPRKNCEDINPLLPLVLCNDLDVVTNYFDHMPYYLSYGKLPWMMCSDMNHYHYKVVEEIEGDGPYLWISRCWSTDFSDTPATYRLVDEDHGEFTEDRTEGFTYRTQWIWNLPMPCSDSTTEFAKLCYTHRYFRGELKPRRD